MKEYRCLGIMIGSSLDGIDVLDCSISFDGNWSYIVHEYFEFPLTESLKHELLNYKKLTKSEVFALESDLANYLAICLISDFNFQSRNIELIGFHGVTVSHIPKNKESIQLGDAQVLANKLNTVVVANFRQEDMECGGEGTPMAPLVEKYLFDDYKFFLNLGGIANISDHSGDNVIAFDVCPFNQVLNHYASKKGILYDVDGLLAQSGTPDSGLFSFLGSLDYFNQMPPKSLDNNWIREVFMPSIDDFDLSLEDILSTMVSFFAKAINDCVDLQPLNQKVMVTGGGAFNRFFINQLTEQLKSKNLEVNVPDDLIVQFKEALLIALASVFRMEGKPNFISTVTGASKDVCGGIIYHP